MGKVENVMKFSRNFLFWWGPKETSIRNFQYQKFPFFSAYFREILNLMDISTKEYRLFLDRIFAGKISINFGRNVARKYGYFHGKSRENEKEKEEKPVTFGI